MTLLFFNTISYRVWYNLRYSKVKISSADDYIRNESSNFVTKNAVHSKDTDNIYICMQKYKESYHSIWPWLVIP